MPPILSGQSSVFRELRIEYRPRNKRILVSSPLQKTKIKTEKNRKEKQNKQQKQFFPDVDFVYGTVTLLACPSQKPNWYYI